MIPANAALEADDAAGVERRDRAIPELELAALERESQVVAELPPISEPEIEIGAEQLDPSLAGMLRLVHRGVGPRQQRFGHVSSLDDETATPTLIPIVASASRKLIVSETATTMRFAIAERVVDLLDVLEQDHELVATEARDRVVRAKERSSAGRRPRRARRHRPRDRTRR